MIKPNISSTLLLLVVVNEGHGHLKSMVLCPTGESCPLYPYMLLACLAYAYVQIYLCIYECICNYWFVCCLFICVSFV